MRFYIITPKLNECWSFFTGLNFYSGHKIKGVLIGILGFGFGVETGLK